MPKLHRRGLQRRVSVIDPIQQALGTLKGSARVLAFFRTFLRHPSGEFRGQPFNPLLFQIDFIRKVYDPLLPDGRRQVREALLMLPRKNGKTALCAAIGLYHLFAGEHLGQIVVSANSRDQAGLLFTAAVEMLDASPVLRERATVSRAAKRIVDKSSRSTFRAISAEAGNAHGLSCSLYLVDELHQAKNDDLLTALRTSVGARREPLGVIISTAGFDKLSPLGILYDFGKTWMEDPSINPAFSATIYEAGKDDDWDAEETWLKCNPAAGAFRSIEELRLSAERARQIPSEVDAFRRYYLNQWTSQESSWLDMALWDACKGDIPLDELAGKLAYGGLDLSSTQDLTALTLLIPHNGKTYMLAWCWLPQDDLKERERRDGVPYTRWAEQGYLELTSGNAVDMKTIAQRVKDICRTYDVYRINYDRWGSTATAQDLVDDGIAMVAFGQGFQSMSNPTKALQTAILRQEIIHDGSPLLRWQASKTAIVMDVTGAIKPVKVMRNKRRRHIDSIVAACMAMGALECGAGPDYSELMKNPIII
jgi:phage terminase large subunit-like protein